MMEQTAGLAWRGNRAGLAVQSFFLTALMGAFAFPAGAQTQGLGSGQQGLSEERAGYVCSTFDGKPCPPTPPWPQCHDAFAWGVYISPGFQKDVLWGGYHVTIAGFSKYQGCPNKGVPPAQLNMSLVIRNGWHSATSPTNPMRYSFAPGKITNNNFSWVKNFGWEVKFTSKTMSDFAKYLASHNFDCKSMKGPYCTPSHRWHVTLCEAKHDPRCRQSDPAYARAQWIPLSSKYWYFWKVRIPSTACSDPNPGQKPNCERFDWQQVQ